MASQAAGETDDHKAIVREEFTRQAQAYASAAVITDADRLARLVRAIDPRPDDRALEIATGPGYLAMALAPYCHEVIGLDLTAAPIAIAQRAIHERGLSNIRFEVGEADNLIYGDGEFDLVVCRFAFHHFMHPETILAEMCRVCRVGGTVVVEDLYANENPARAARCNRIEQLRDTSHTRALALSELIAMMGRPGSKSKASIRTGTRPISKAGSPARRRRPIARSRCVSYWRRTCARILSTPVES